MTISNDLSTFYSSLLDDTGGSLCLRASRCLALFYTRLVSRPQRLGLEAYQRLISASSRSQEADVSVSSRPQPFTSRAQDQFSAKL